MNYAEFHTETRGPLTLSLDYAAVHHENLNKVWGIFQRAERHIPGETVEHDGTPYRSINYTSKALAEDRGITLGEAEADLEKECRHYLTGYTLHVRATVTGPTGIGLAHDGISTDYSGVYYSNEEEAAREAAQHNFDVERLFRDATGNLESEIERLRDRALDIEVQTEELRRAQRRQDLIDSFELAGTVSHGTAEPSDVVPKLAGALAELDSDAAEELARAWGGYAESHNDLIGSGAEAARIMAAAATKSIGEVARAAESGGTLMSLWDDLDSELNAAAPDGFRFGAHIGDGSDFGFWVVEDDV